jgi:hypothetical protein
MRGSRVRRAGWILLAASLLVGSGIALAQAPAKGGAKGHLLKTKAAKTTALKPSGKSEVLKLQVGKKSSRYYKASKAAPVEFAVTGRTSVRVLSRIVLGTGTTPPAAYSLKIELDGKVVQTVKLAVKMSAKATLAGARLGVVKKVVVPVPAGKHRLRLSPLEDGVSLAVRGLRGTAAKKSAALVPFAPESYERVLRLHLKDEESTVYRFTPEKPVEMALLGPLRLKVETRLDFSMANGVTQNYVVQARVDGQIKESFPLKSRASHVASYPEMGEVVPGMARPFELKLPSGSHRLALVLTGTTAGGATARILIPRPTQHVSNGR